MPADQWKARVLIMIERRRSPRASGMAAGTIGTARSVVRIIFGVASITLLRGARPALAGMALQARQGAVASRQRKARF